MTDNILEKAKKRRMSAYVHANLNKPIDVGALQLIENTLRRANAQDEAELPTEDNSVGKGKSPRKRITYNNNYHLCDGCSHATPPGTEAAEACVEAEATKASYLAGTGTDPGARYSGAVRGNAIMDMFSPTGDYAQRRGDTMPITAGHAAESAASNLNPSGMANGLAVGHIDLRNQSTPKVTGPMVTTHSVNGDNQYGDRDITHSTGSATISRFDANQHAGSYDGMRMPGGLPSSPVSHTARDSATPATPGHSPANPASNVMKSNLDIMKTTMRRMG